MTSRGACADIATLVKDVGGWLADFEGELLYDLARRCQGRGVIVEIGSFKGKSTIWLAKGSKAGRSVPVYAIDPHTGSDEHRRLAPVATFGEFRANLRAAEVEDLVVPLVTTAEEAAHHFRHPVELVFIDGAHEYERVRADFLTWFPKVIDGGVMAFHDTTVGWDGPRRVAEEFIYRSRHFRRVRLVGSITFGEKTAQATVGDRLRSRWVLGLKQTADAARGVPLPRVLRTFGRGLLERVQ